jgi:hypothetical protein
MLTNGIMELFVRSNVLKVAKELDGLVDAPTPAFSKVEVITGAARRRRFSEKSQTKPDFVVTFYR